MKLLIRNLSRKTSEQSLRELFEAYGSIQSITLVMDTMTNVSKGFGFIDMPKQGEAKVAMKNLNGREVDGFKIRVKKAEDKPEVRSEIK